MHIERFDSSGLEPMFAATAVAMQAVSAARQLRGHRIDAPDGHLFRHMVTADDAAYDRNVTYGMPVPANVVGHIAFSSEIAIPAQLPTGRNDVLLYPLVPHRKSTAIRWLLRKQQSTVIRLGLSQTAVSSQVDIISRADAQAEVLRDRYPIFNAHDLSS